MQTVKSWLRQPTTIAGISALVATIVAIVLHQITAAEAIPIMSGAVTSMLLPDNSGAKAQATALAAEIVAAAQKERTKHE